MSPDILAHVFEHESTVEVWATIVVMFSSASRLKISHLQTALNNTKNLRVAQYLTKMKGFAFKLAAAEKTIDDV
jgi:GH15 family glucan-1,4-alpha-glucosidase